MCGEGATSEEAQCLLWQSLSSRPLLSFLETGFLLEPFALYSSLENGEYFRSPLVSGLGKYFFPPPFYASISLVLWTKVFRGTVLPIETDYQKAGDQSGQSNLAVNRYNNS